MLFDLRGRGRRRVVKFVYVSLAVLMGGGLILFGIGGATSGGLLDAFKSNGGSANVSEVFKKRIDAAEAAVKARPQDAAAWRDLTRVRYQQAISGDGYDQNAGTFTQKGKAQLQGVGAAWTRYLSLAGSKPDPNLAILLVNVFGSAGLNQPAKAVDAMEVYLGSQKPTAQLYTQYAALAYEAGQTRKGDLASQKALSLAPKDSREQIKGLLDSAKAAAASTATPSTSTTPSS